MKIKNLLFWLFYLAVNLMSLYFVLGLLLIFNTFYNNILIPESFNFSANIIIRCLILLIESLLMLGAIFLVNLLLLNGFSLVYKTSKFAKVTLLIEMVFIFAVVILVMSGIYSKGG